MKKTKIEKWVFFSKIFLEKEKKKWAVFESEIVKPIKCVEMSWSADCGVFQIPLF